jgi:broad specificity phosphatase PhoE
MEISYDQNIIVASHGHSVFSEGAHILTEHGQASTECLINELAGFASVPKSMISIWSSPHPSAIQTAFELSKTIGVEVKLTYRLTDKLSSRHEVEVIKQNAQAYARSLLKKGRSTEQSNERPMQAGVSQFVNEGAITYESLQHLDEVMNSDSPESIESMLKRVIDLVEAICRSRTACSDKLVYLFTHQSMLDLLLAKYNTQSEGSHIGFVRFIAVNSKHFSRLVPYNDEMVSIRMSSLRTVLGEMMEERARRYQEVSDSYKTQVQAKQTQLREARGQVRDLAAAVRSSIASLKRAMIRAKLLKRQNQLSTQTQRGDSSNEQSGRGVDGNVVEIIHIEVVIDKILIYMQPKVLRREPRFFVFCFEVEKYYGPCEVPLPTKLFTFEIDASEFSTDPDLKFVICDENGIVSPVFSWRFSPTSS